MAKRRTQKQVFEDELLYVIALCEIAIDMEEKCKMDGLGKAHADRFKLDPKYRDLLTRYLSRKQEAYKNLGDMAEKNWNINTVKRDIVNGIQ